MLAVTKKLSFKNSLGSEVQVRLKRLLNPLTLVALAMLAGGCVFDLGGGASEKADTVQKDDHKGVQVISIDAPSVRAKFDIVDDRSKKVIVKGVTPDTVLLNTNGDYRVKITHPKTGKVYTEEIKSRKNADGKTLLIPEAVTAEF